MTAHFTIDVKPQALPDTNKALELHFGYGWVSALADAAGKRRPPSRYAEAAKVLRFLAAIAARKARLPSCQHPVDIDFFFCGFETWDADAWYLPGKWILDGLRDAGVIRNDRTMVGRIAGQILRAQHPRIEVRLTDGLP